MVGLKWTRWILRELATRTRIQEEMIRPVRRKGWIRTTGRNPLLRPSVCPPCILMHFTPPHLFFYHFWSGLKHIIRTRIQEEMITPVRRKGWIRTKSTISSLCRAHLHSAWSSFKTDHGPSLTLRQGRLERSPPGNGHAGQIIAFTKSLCLAINTHGRHISKLRIPL